MATELEKSILRKMYLDKYIGGRHTSADNIPKGFPRHLRGDCKKAIKNLVRHGYIMPKITSYGLEVSLDPRKIEEIKQITSIK